MAMGSATTQQMSLKTQSQHGNANVSSISISNGTVSNGTGLTVSNLGYYTTASNSMLGIYTNYMKPKTFKLR